MSLAELVGVVEHTPVEPSQLVPSENECASVLRRLRWGDGPTTCVKCTSKKVVRDGASGATNKYRCKKCGLHFNDKSRTIFQDTKVPLSKWFEAALLIEEESSVTDVAKRIRLSYRNTYYMLKKLRGDPIAAEITRVLKSAEKRRGALPELALRSTTTPESFLRAP